MVNIVADELMGTVQRWRTRLLADQLHIYHSPADSKEPAVFAMQLYGQNVMVASMSQDGRYIILTLEL